MKFLTAENTQPLILSILQYNELSGYEIIQSLEEEFGGRLPFKDGYIYPVVKKMEWERLIVSRWKEQANNRARRLYSFNLKFSQNHTCFDRIKEWIK